MGILVLGIGKTGTAVSKWLKKNNIEFFTFDDSIKTQFDQNIFKKIKLIVQSPGIPSDHKIILKAKELGITVCSDLDLFFSNYNPKLSIGITGTNGKSTLTALLDHCLKKLNQKSTPCGNFNESPLHFEFEKETAYVVECSSYQLEISKPLPFDIGVLLNITPDHLQRHGTMSNYSKAKSKIFTNSTNKIVCIDDDYCLKIASNLDNLTTISFKETNADFFIKDGVLFQKSKDIFSICDHKYLKGNHNYQNIAAAFASLKILNYQNEEIINAINSFKGLSHRQEFITGINSVKFINDSKATNVFSTLQAIKSYENIFWIAGGRYKGCDFNVLNPFMSNVKECYFFGESKEIFKEHFPNGKLFETLKESVIKAFEDASKIGGVILFSPACSSFDQFLNFEHRGDEFRKICMSIKEEIVSF